MQILLLGPYRQKIIDFLSDCGDSAIAIEGKITSSSDALNNVDFLISYGYRHILKEDILVKFSGKAINIHISLLPWNRGADPNFWSFLENSPKGVTIHCLDSGIDTGSILVQKEIQFSEEDTLRTSYVKLTENAEELLEKYWVDIRDKKISPIPQPPGGSFHRLRDKSKYEHLLTQGWDTPVRDLIGKALHQSK